MSHPKHRFAGSDGGVDHGDVFCQRRLRNKPAPAQADPRTESDETQWVFHLMIACPHLSLTCRARSSGTATDLGKSFSHSYGLHASITARELKPFFCLGTMGSKGPLQQRRKISISSLGSQRVVMAHSTSFISAGSMSSST